MATTAAGVTLVTRLISAITRWAEAGHQRAPLRRRERVGAMPISAPHLSSVIGSPNCTLTRP